MSSAVAGWFVAALSLAHYLLSLSLPLALNPSHLLRLHFYLSSSVMGQIKSAPPFRQTRGLPKPGSPHGGAPSSVGVLVCCGAAHSITGIGGSSLLPFA